MSDSNPREPDQAEFDDLDRRRSIHRRSFDRRQPKRINNVIAQLVQRRGYAQVRAAGAQDEAWQSAIGDQWPSSTQVAGIRRGVFEVVVANSLILQELTFEKEELLVQLQQALPDAGIKQLRFRIGQIN